MISCTTIYNLRRKNWR